MLRPQHALLQHQSRSCADHTAALHQPNYLIAPSQPLNMSTLGSAQARPRHSKGRATVAAGKNQTLALIQVRIKVDPCPSKVSLTALPAQGQAAVPSAPLAVAVPAKKAAAKACSRRLDAVAAPFPAKRAACALHSSGSGRHHPPALREARWAPLMPPHAPTPPTVLPLPPPPPRPALLLLLLLPQNLNCQSTSMAQWNLDSRLLLKTFSMGTSFLLHHATVMRGSM